MNYLFLGFLLASHVALANPASWFCQCFEQGKGLMWVSLDAGGPLGEAQSKALELCRKAGNSGTPTRATCVKHVGKDGPPAVLPAPPPAVPPETKAAYQALLRANAKKQYSTMLQLADQILSRGSDYNDTRAYRAIALAKLAKNEAGCRETGGEWGSWTRFDADQGLSTCRWRALDSGRECRDGKDCSSSSCEWAAAKKAGACAPYASAEGCHTWVKHGEPQPRICVD